MSERFWVHVMKVKRTFRSDVGFRDRSAGNGQRNLCDWVQSEMLHEARKIKVLERISVGSIERFCNLGRLIDIDIQFLHFVKKQLICAASAIGLPCRRSEDL